MWQMPDSMRLATAERALNVAAEHRRGQAVFGVVGDADRFVLVRCTRMTGLTGPERFLAVDPHVRRDVVDDRRLDDRAVAFAAGDDLAALGDRVGDQRVHALGRREIDQRAEHDMAARIAGRQRRRALGELRDESVGDRSRRR